MSLTLRPTRLSRDPNRDDYSVHEDGGEIGRMYEDSARSRPELAWSWFWSIIVLGPARGRVKTDGRAATFEDAKAQFKANWEKKWLGWAKLKVE